MPRARRTSLLPKRFVRTMWALAAFFAAGYLPTIFLGNPVVGMGLAAGLMAVFGMRAPSVLRGALSGAAFGCLAGLAMFGALTIRLQPMLGGLGASPSTQPATAPATATSSAPATAPAATTSPTTVPAMPPLSMKAMRRIRLICVLGTGAMCAVVGAVFAYFATKRRRRVDREWG